MADEPATIPEEEPQPAGGRDPVSPGRRSFLGVLLGAGSTIIGVLMAIPLVRFALYPMFAESGEAQWSDLGSVDAFASLTTPVQKLVTIRDRDGWRDAVSQKAVYVTKNQQGQLEVLTAVCPHLGCEIPWNESRKEFFCPCHGSSFAPDGARLGGPTPRGMDSLPTTTQNGHLMVRYEYFRQLAPTKEVVS